MLNHTTDAKRAAALASVRHGRIYDLGHILDEHVPVFPGRAFHQTLATSAHHANRGGIGDNHVNWITEVVSGTTQLGTHLDSLSHLQIGDRGYNGWTVSELAEPWGVSRLGAETILQIVTKGWLVDVAKAGLAAGDEITADDIERALDGAQHEPGDAVLFHTGWRNSASALIRSSTPVRKSFGAALTVPTITLFPSTKPWLILSELIVAVRSPPVIEASTRTPFLPSTWAASDNRAEAGRVEDHVEWAALSGDSASEKSCEE